MTDGGRTWINSSTLLGSANLVRALVQGMELEKLPARAGAHSPEEMVDWTFELLVAVPVIGDARDSIITLAQRKQTDQHRIANTIHATAALPEFQLV